MESIPIQLQRQIPGGLEEILNRLPENYVRTVFCTHLASLFVYQYGLRAGLYLIHDQYIISLFPYLLILVHFR